MKLNDSVQVHGDSHESVGPVVEVRIEELNACMDIGMFSQEEEAGVQEYLPDTFYRIFLFELS